MFVCWILIHLIFFVLEFAKNHLPLLSSNPIGKLIKQTQLDKSDIEIWGLQYKEPEPTWFFQINENTLLCVSSSTMSTEDFYLFAQTVSINVQILLYVVSLYLFYLNFEIYWFLFCFQKTKLNNIPPLEEMTAELEVYYFPEKAPKYEYALGEEDLYMKKLTDGKKGHHQKQTSNFSVKS